MSSLSLLYGAQDSAASFQLLIDQVLLEASTDIESDVNELAILFRSASNVGGGETSHDGVLLDSFLRGSDGQVTEHLGKLADALFLGTIDPDTRASLERIAERLNKERVGLAHRAAAE